ncbi:MAG: sensor histidine kinase [Acidimicrobiales bacterium]
MAVALIVIVVSVVGYLVTRHSTDQQEHALLQSDATQAAAYASDILSDLGTLLNSAATGVTATDGSPSAFSRSPGDSATLPLVLVRKSGSSYVVIATAGKSDFHTGQVLGGAALATVEQAASAKAKGQAMAGPVSYDGKDSTARFAIGAPSVPAGLAVYEQFSLDPYTATPVTTGKPFDQLKAVLYGAGSPETSHLLVSTSSVVPLSGSVVRATVPVGSSNWTLVAAARRPFIGGVAKTFPLILLCLGVVFAVLIGVTVEILHRRNRYATALVEDRTADLNQSLRNLEEAQDALVRGERLTAVGEMAMVVGHELRNPLAAVTNALYLIRRELPQPVSDLLSRNLDMAERETQKASTLADDLTAFVRPREMDLTSIDITDLVEEVLAATPPPPGIELMSDLESYTFAGDRGQMAEVLTNVLTNAYQAMPQGGTVRVSARMSDDVARLVVEDAGPGFDEAVQDRVFEPFFTTKHSGTGLGMAIVHRLVSAHGGTIRLENVPTGGARVTVELPVLVEAVPS